MHTHEILVTKMLHDTACTLMDLQLVAARRQWTHQEQWALANQLTGITLALKQLTEQLAPALMLQTGGEIQPPGPQSERN